MRLRNHLIIPLCISGIIFVMSFSGIIYAQTTPTDSPTPTSTPTPTGTTDNSDQINQIKNQIQDLQNKVNDLQSQEKTLSSQIQVMNNQIELTQLRITETQSELTGLTLDIGTANKKITILEGSLTNITKVLINRIVATYQEGNVNSMDILLSSGDVSNYLTKASYLRLVQEHDKRLIYDTQQAREDYQNQKGIFEAKKAQAEALKSQLETYTTQLGQQEDAKKSLLSDTQGSEVNYERLLAQAEAQLAGFSSFTASQGGASLLSGQTVCDDWGCYYNQRDTQWGATALNNTQYSIASDGCLMTSMAMVYTHFGHKSVTPLTINSDSNNFASYYPAYLKYTISADGATFNRVGIGVGDIDGELSAGRPVIVGISYDGGPLPDHFVVLISGSNGSYQMNDPFTPNGHNIPFTDHYSVASIREVDKIEM